MGPSRLSGKTWDVCDGVVCKSVSTHNHRVDLVTWTPPAGPPVIVCKSVSTHNHRVDLVTWTPSAGPPVIVCKSVSTHNHRVDLVTWTPPVDVAIRRG